MKLKIYEWKEDFFSFSGETGECLLLCVALESWKRGIGDTVLTGKIQRGNILERIRVKSYLIKGLFPHEISKDVFSMQRADAGAGKMPES